MMYRLLLETPRFQLRLFIELMKDKCLLFHYVQASALHVKLLMHSTALVDRTEIAPDFFVLHASLL